MLVSLGGTPEVPVFSLNHHRPQHVLLFVSAGSDELVQAVMRGLDYRCAHWEKIVSPSAERLDDCYRALRDEVPRKLGAWGLQPNDLTVDYTGGTKSMSAALVLATIDWTNRYSYVGGEERDKGGLGVVIAGRERMLYLQNPWKELLREEFARVRLYFGGARYGAALDELIELVHKADPLHRPLLAALAELAAGCAEWDAFRYARAVHHLGRAHRFLAPFAAGARDAGWARLATSLNEILHRLELLVGKPPRDPALAAAWRRRRHRASLLDLLANADRRAALERKYEEAVARLYSCLERAARYRLVEHGGERFDSGRFPATEVPAALRAEFERRYGGEAGTLRLPLLACYQLLAARGDELGTRFAARQVEFLQLLSLRNLSYLGHGERAVDREDYRRFRRAVLALLRLRARDLPRIPELPALELGAGKAHA